MDTGRLQRAITQYVQKYVQANQKNTAKTGFLKGDKVTIGNRSYNFDSTVYDYTQEGSQVYCLLTDDKRKAVIVGVK